MWLETACAQRPRTDDPIGYRRHAAFNLHQAAETAYTCFLLVRSHYVQHSHNLKFLRSLAEDTEPRLVDAWPRATKLDRRRFELAKRAYVEARYSTSYEIDADDLQAIMNSVRHLRDTVESVSRDWLDVLWEKVGAAIWAIKGQEPAVTGLVLTAFLPVERFDPVHRTIFPGVEKRRI